MTNDMPNSATYPEGYGRCVLCGAGRDEPVFVVSPHAVTKETGS